MRRFCIASIVAALLTLASAAFVREQIHSRAGADTKIAPRLIHFDRTPDNFDELSPAAPAGIHPGFYESREGEGNCTAFPGVPREMRLSRELDRRRAARWPEAQVDGKREQFFPGAGQFTAAAPKTNSAAASA